jgi:hypothetical protein
MSSEPVTKVRDECLTETSDDECSENGKLQLHMQVCLLIIAMRFSYFYTLYVLFTVTPDVKTI